MSNIGEVLATARRASGLSQADLAQSVGITQAALSRYEHNLRSPDEAVLDLIAHELGVTAELLRRADRVRGAMAVDAHMRRRATAKATVWKRLEARLNMLRLHAHKIFEEVDLHTEQTLPQFDPFEVRPGDAARLLRMQWRMPVGPVRNLVQWMEGAGCLIIEEDFGTTRVDALSQWIDGHPIVLVNVKSPTDRKRLTLAHELGHLCLHSIDIADDIEADANTFAAEFLMPTETIRPQLRNLTLGKLHDLKREWQVSMQSIIERAYGLNLIAPSQRTSLYKRFSAAGWRTSEPLSDQLLPEIPQLSGRIGQAMTGQGMTPEEIATLTGYAADRTDNPFLVPSATHLRVV
ncbi:MAG: helix-turn-helix domain-containing protein [Microthrixaceae bacterium]